MIKKIIDEKAAINIVEYTLPVLVIGIVSRTFPGIYFLYYIVPALFLIYIILGSIFIKLKDVNLILILVAAAFPTYTLITTAWSLYPLETLQRSAYLLFMNAGILSAVILYKRSLSEKGISFLIPANILIIGISLISLITNSPADNWTGGNGLGFMGFAGHQNTLAIALLFTLPGVIALVNSDQTLRQAQGDKASSLNDGNKLYLFLTSHVFRLSSFIFLFTANLLLLLLTYSRASILALVVGVITYLLIIKSKIILSVLFSLSAFLIVLYSTVSPIQNSIDSVLTKDGGNILGRRMILWEPSFEAAKMGGLFGLGYGVSAPGIKTPLKTGSHYEDRRYIREKGNSILAVIEETGLFGLLLFLLPVILLIRKFSMFNSQFSIKEKPKNNYTCYTCLPHRDLRPVGKVVYCTLLAMLIHSQFEAWWVGVGSVALPLFLIFLFMALLPDKS